MNWRQTLTLFSLAWFAGCATNPPALPPETFALVTYTTEFSAKVAAQLKGAPPELAQVVVDYEKLRCAINPALPVCKDLLK